MKILLTIMFIFLFFFSMSMFGFYIELDSFIAIGGKEFMVSCGIGFVGLLFSWLVVGILS